MSHASSDRGASAGAAADPMERPLPGRTEYPHVVDWENEWESLLEDPAFEEGAPAGSESDSDEAAGTERGPQQRNRDQRIRALLHRMPHVPRPEGQHCSICTSEAEDDARPGVTLPCSHWFHEECLLPWLLRRVTCPNCRGGVGDGSR